MPAEAKRMWSTTIVWIVALFGQAFVAHIVDTDDRRVALVVFHSEDADALLLDKVDDYSPQSKYCSQYGLSPSAELDAYIIIIKVDIIRKIFCNLRLRDNPKIVIVRILELSNKSIEIHVGINPTKTCAAVTEWCRRDWIAVLNKVDNYVNKSSSRVILIFFIIWLNRVVEGWYGYFTSSQ